MSLAYQNLKIRAEKLAASRAFFAKKGVLEVDCPILHRGTIVDAYIDPIVASVCGKPCYLHTSPESSMKRLLAQGSGDIYQIARVFRDHEKGRWHHVEFTMVEWYRMGFSLQEMIEETLAYLSLFIPLSKERVYSYEELFHRYAHCDFDALSESEGDRIFAEQIQPNLKQLTVVTPYPASKSALAKVRSGQAQRFEIFYQGIELANGYEELTDCVEQRRRFESENEKREKLGKKSLPLDEHFLAMKALPECCGVSVGFDRGLLLCKKADHLKDVIIHPESVLAHP